MNKRVFLLNGLAILSVVLNHATSWGYTAMFWWTNRYRSVTVPNYDQVGTWPYYVVSVVRQLTLFSVPAFVFVSGFFIAYAARGDQSTLTWKMVRTRIQNLLVPYFIWSLVIFVGDALQGIRYTPIEYGLQLVIGKVEGGYYFVPLLCQLYLLSPWVTLLAKTRWRQLLVGTALLQIAAMSVIYIRFLWGMHVGSLDITRFIMPEVVFVRWGFFFSFGVVGGLYLQQFQQWLTRVRWFLLAAAIILGVLSILEPELVYRWIKEDWHGNAALISTSLYATAFVPCLLAFDRVFLPFSQALHQLASRSFGIYLLHDKWMELVARVIRQLVPWILSQQWLFQPVLILVGLSGPLLLMTAVTRSPARRCYRYLFG